MIYTARESRFGFYSRLCSILIISTFLFTTILPPGYAQTIGLSLPVPGTMVQPSPAFAPVLLKGMTVHTDDPFKFNFIVNTGQTDFSEENIREESQRLVKYFLAAMTVPERDLWVNLSPYEADRIIPEELGKTELGRDLLAQDYILKQFSASLMNPEKELGKKFWDRVYAKTQEQFGTADIPIDTFNKVWILPDSATVYEHDQTVYIVDSKLKVMLDSDYEAMSQSGNDQGVKTDMQELKEDILREVILPEIEREVNEGANFAPLRQIYYSLILAQWYKETIKDGLLSQAYVDQNKVKGIDIDEATFKETIYSRYMEAYKKGVFQLIKEEYNQLSHEVIPREYFSGGFQEQPVVFDTEGVSREDVAAAASKGENFDLEIGKGTPIHPEGNKGEDQAMLSKQHVFFATSALTIGAFFISTLISDGLRDTVGKFVIWIFAAPFVLAALSHVSDTYIYPVYDWIYHSFFSDSPSFSSSAHSSGKTRRFYEVEGIEKETPKKKKRRKQKDEAMVSGEMEKIQDVKTDVNGGIDMNDITVNHEGRGVDIHFSPEAMQSVEGIDGFTPVIINMIPINNILPMLGFADENGGPAGQQV